jgi:CubicO group peptidase (beta-lactamase class C family)
VSGEQLQAVVIGAGWAGKGHTLAFQPGTAWRYSVAYDVLAYLVEIVSGQAFDAYLRETLFEPLGMVDTGFCVREGVGCPGETTISRAISSSTISCSMPSSWRCTLPC